METVAKYLEKDSGRGIVRLLPTASIGTKNSCLLGARIFDQLSVHSV